jgi:TPR repeat protein
MGTRPTFAQKDQRPCLLAGTRLVNTSIGCLGTGLGIEANAEEEAKYYKLSADQGNGFGEAAYDRCLRRGIAIERNDSEAAKYSKLSADQGTADGQASYGICRLESESRRTLKKR